MNVPSSDLRLSSSLASSSYLKLSYTRRNARRMLQGTPDKMRHLTGVQMY